MANSKRKTESIGLKDAARAWNKLLLDKFQSYGLKKIRAAPCVFVKKGLVVICYVDDLVAYTDAEDAITNFKSHTSKKLKVKELGISKQFLGIKQN